MAPAMATKHNMGVERAAVELILSKEPSLKWTKPGNHGFDLWEPGPNDSPVEWNKAENQYELGPDDRPERWIEVKSGAGEMPSVTLSVTQFLYALEKQGAYWLYVVENATTPNPGHPLKILNPAQKILDSAEFSLPRAWIIENQTQDNPEEN